MSYPPPTPQDELQRTLLEMLALCGLCFAPGYYLFIRAWTGFTGFQSLLEAYLLIWLIWIGAWSYCLWRGSRRQGPLRRLRLIAGILILGAFVINPRVFLLLMYFALAYFFDYDVVSRYWLW